MKKIRIAQIGITHEHAAGKLETLRRLSEVFEIAGVVDDIPTVHTPVFGNPACFPWKEEPRLTLEQVLEDSSIEAVTVEMPNNECVPVALQCMERGKAIHMDKPGGTDSALYKKLLDGCQTRKLPFQIGYMFRGNPAMAFALEAVAKGWLGNVVGVQASMIHDYGSADYQRYLSGFPGGIIYNLGCHFIDFFIQLLGCPEKIASFLQDGPNAAAGSGNLALTVFQYPHAIATIRAFDQEPFGSRRVRIDGDMGLMEWMPVERFDGHPLEVTLALREGNECYTAGWHQIPLGPVCDRYETQLLEFARVIRGEAQDSYTRQHDYDVHRAVLAASGIRPWHK